MLGRSGVGVVFSGVEERMVVILDWEKRGIWDRHGDGSDGWMDGLAGIKDAVSRFVQ